MSTYWVEWNSGKESTEVHSADELDIALDRVEHERGETDLPFKVDIGDGTGDEDVSYGLVVGMGQARSALMWIGPPRGGMGVEAGVPAWDGEPIAFDHGANTYRPGNDPRA